MADARLVEPCLVSARIELDREVALLREILSSFGGLLNPHIFRHLVQAGLLELAP